MLQPGQLRHRSLWVAIPILLALVAAAGPKIRWEAGVALPAFPARAWAGAAGEGAEASGERWEAPGERGEVPGEGGEAPGEAADAAALVYEVVAGESEARYRVREQLLGLDFPQDAVGTTHEVQGTVTFGADGAVVPERSRIVANLAALRSDQERRDQFLFTSTLETRRYPEAVFVPVEVRGLAFPLPREGAGPITVAGDLTVRDVTRRVEWSGEATFQEDGFRVRVRTAFRFADFGMRPPRLALVLSVEDRIRAEADIRFRRVAAPPGPFD